MRPKPMILVILDGWGMCNETEHNAIYHAQTPHFDRWWKSRPHALVQTCAEHVGLPDGQMGNSEVGHMNLGAGRIVYQDFTRINLSVQNGSYIHNPELKSTIQKANQTGGAIHLFALLSPGGVHSHTDHILATVQASKQHGAKRIYIHAVLDGRDTPPRSALDFLKTFQEGLIKIGAGQVVSVCGRYYAMDRDKRWKRVQKAYDMLTLGHGKSYTSAASAIQEGYLRGEDDEFIQPSLIVAPGDSSVFLKDGDALLMLNFRADRVREMCHALLDPNEGERAFTGFERIKIPKLSSMFTLTRYDDGLDKAVVGFPPQTLNHLLGDVFADNSLTQLRAAETEKYAHVTYFFNGGKETPVLGEERLLLPSPSVDTYDLKPEMSAETLTDQLLERIALGKYDCIIVNYANSDMVGHTGKFDAACLAIETIDACLGRLAQAVHQAGGEMLITADHGNADCMQDAVTGQPHTAHTQNPAPLIYLGREAQAQDGKLCDIAPTLLYLMDLPQPKEMEGVSLIKLQADTFGEG